MIYHVSHETTYQYRNDVSISHNLVHLTPRACPRQTLVSEELSVSVPPAVSAVQLDFFGNPMMVFTIQEPHRPLTARAANVVEAPPGPPPAPAGSTPWDEARRSLRADRRPE